MAKGAFLSDIETLRRRAREESRHADPPDFSPEELATRSHAAH